MGWLKEGYFISYEDDSEAPPRRRYWFVIGRELSHYECKWDDLKPAGEALTAGSFAPGPYIVADLEPTLKNQMFQVIFGFKPQIYLYTYLPSDLIRRGLPKRPRATSAFPTVGHLIEHWSPYDAPSFWTQHFMIRPLTYNLGFAAYNPFTYTIDEEEIFLNFIVNELQLEHIGDVVAGELQPAATRFTETLDKLTRRVIPHTPITLGPIRAPVTAPARPP